jgi:predicted transcriptional regulator
MGITKTEGKHPLLLQRAELFKALGHPARLAIVEHLLHTPNCICGELTEVTGLSQPTTSQHLKELKNVGIIQGTVTGNKVCYCLNSATFTALRSFFNNSIEHFSDRNQCC